MVTASVVIALVKLENLKANHNHTFVHTIKKPVVIALVKLENLKANHNANSLVFIYNWLLLH